MRLSTKSRYGTRALLDLALHNDGTPVMLKDIARRQDISLAYLEHIIAPLIAAGMVRSSRGAKGGVSLAKPPRSIRLSEIVKALEGPIALVECTTDRLQCKLSDTCTIRGVWGDMEEAIVRVLSSFTLQDLADRQMDKQHAATDMYNI